MEPEPSKGRGRGLALIQALKKSQMMNSPEESPESSTAPTPAPNSSFTPVSSIAATPASSMVSAVAAMPSVMRGRGRLPLMLKKMHEGTRDPVMTPASDVSPSPSVLGSTGRGLKLLQSLKAQTSPQPPGAKSEISAITEQMSQTSLATATTSKNKRNKFFREVKDTPPVVRKGESGVPCDVTTNFIYLRFEENCVFEYEVKYEPDQDYKHLRFKLLDEHSHLFKEKTFDGTTLYIPHKLPDDITSLTSTNPYDGSKVQLIIKFRRTRRLSEMIHIYNVLFKHIMKDLKLVRFARQHFNEHMAIQIPQHKLEVWPGYVTAVDEYEGGLMLTLDSTHRVLRTEKVLDLIKDISQKHASDWVKVATEILVGCTVMTIYNKKLFKVDSIVLNMNPQSTFERKDGDNIVKISYIDYYKNNYGIHIKDWTQPMLISRVIKRMPGSEETTEFQICLVPELCQLTGLTDAQRSNFTLMKDVATYTRITPNQRHAAFKQFIQNVLSNENAKKRLAGWGLSIAPQTIDIVARTLQPETITFGNDIKVHGNFKADWKGDASRNPVIHAVDIFRWVILYTKRDENSTYDFLKTMKYCAKPMGIVVKDPEMVLLPTDRIQSYVSALKSSLSNALQLVVCICPTSRDDRYEAIKKICCAENPIPSQVINARTIMNQQKIRAVTQKIALQINCKLGGTLWSISIPLKTVMVIGVDSYHDAKFKKRSVCAFVASYNQSLTHWYSRAVFQEPGQEIVDSLKACLVQALNHYLKVNGTLPDKIIMYRDGVGDGQLKLVNDYEIPQLQVCFSLVDATYKPKLMYVVVQKRINTRIFKKLNGNLENPPPGTVVDHDITRRNWYDFLIVSQYVTQGTVTPTHYIVVHDSIGMTPDQCQRLTYKLCHLYYNWPGTVRVPAPCQYAHKLAYLVGQSIHQSPSDVLADKLFFL